MKITKTAARKLLGDVVSGTADVPAEPETLAVLLEVASGTRREALAKALPPGEAGDRLWEEACDIRHGHR